MEGLIKMVLVMLYKNKSKHPDISAYEAMLDQVKRVYHSGDTDATKTVKFVEGLVAVNMGLLVGHKRDLKAASKIDTIKLSPDGLKRMKAAAEIISEMVPGPIGIVIVKPSPIAIGQIAAGILNPQAFCLPPETKISVIPADGRTVREVAETLKEQCLLVPNLPDDQIVTLDQLKMVTAALFALNIEIKVSMLLCFVSIAGQLIDDGHNDAAEIFLGW